MIDNEKVLTGLEEVSDYLFDRYIWENDEESKTAKDMCDKVRDAMQFLKQNEAKPVTYDINEYTGLPVATCPSCGKCLKQFQPSYDDEETKFCSHCGQGVKWNE